MSLITGGSIERFPRRSRSHFGVVRLIHRGESYLRRGINRKVSIKRLLLNRSRISFQNEGKSLQVRPSVFPSNRASSNDRRYLSGVLGSILTGASWFPVRERRDGRIAANLDSFVSSPFWIVDKPEPWPLVRFSSEAIRDKL